MKNQHIKSEKLTTSTTVQALASLVSAAQQHTTASPMASLVTGKLETRVRVEYWITESRNLDVREKIENKDPPVDWHQINTKTYSPNPA